MPATSGSPDPAARAGGPGEVVDLLRDITRRGHMVYVTLDGSTDGPLLFDARELKREPTI